MSPVKAGRDLCLVLPVLSALGCKQLIPRAPRPGPWAPWTRPQAALPTTCLCLQSPTWEPHPWPINSCIWMDTQRCDLPRLRTDHIFIQASWQHTNHSAKLRHLGQVPGRNLESDPHYPLMGSPGTPPTPSSVDSHLRGSQEVTPLSEFSSWNCLCFALFKYLKFVLFIFSLFHHDYNPHLLPCSGAP